MFKMTWQATSRAIITLSLPIAKTKSYYMVAVLFIKILKRVTKNMEEYNGIKIELELLLRNYLIRLINKIVTYYIK
jgi:hypothetical protein